MDICTFTPIHGFMAGTGSVVTNLLGWRPFVNFSTSFTWHEPCQFASRAPSILVASLSPALITCIQPPGDKQGIHTLGTPSQTCYQNPKDGAPRSWACEPHFVCICIRCAMKTDSLTSWPGPFSKHDYMVTQFESSATAQAVQHALPKYPLCQWILDCQSYQHMCGATVHHRSGEDTKTDRTLIKVNYTCTASLTTWKCMVCNNHA